MNSISRVLAAIDFSKPAGDAFDHALALSRQHDAELIAVQAVPIDETFGHYARARLALGEKLRRQAERAGVALSVRVQRGDPADIVLLHARSLRPDVIVVGTHQRRGVNRLRHGSIAERIVAKAEAPVLLVPHRRRTRASADMRHVVVAVDFTAASSQAIAAAMSLAKDAATHITLVHVVTPSSSIVPPHLYGYGVEEQHDPVMVGARARLQRAVTGAELSHQHIGVEVLRGDPATEVSQFVRDVGADLLIVGGTSRGVVSRTLFGTTTARLLRSTPVPVLVTPAAQRVVTGDTEIALRPAA